MKHILAAFLLFGYASLSAQQESIEQVMDALSANKQFSGAVIVARQGKIIFKKGYGLANVKTGEPFLTSTPCYIGSVSKQFTAVAIMQLKERYRLSLDNRLTTYLVDLPDIYREVTIRDMLRHTSGLPLFADFPDMTEEDVLAIVKKQTVLRFAPGSRYEYCNANYTLLGMIVAKLSGLSFHEYLAQNVFAPAGMKDTYLDVAGIRNRKRAKGYYLFGDENNYNTYIGGAASVVSTADDLRRWDSTITRQQLLSAEGWQQVFSIQSPGWQHEGFGRTGYGYGWFISDDNRKEKIMQHDGGFGGFRSYIERQSSGNTIILLSNVRHESTTALRNTINNILHDKPYTHPKISGANQLVANARVTGMQVAISEYKQRQLSKDSSKYYFSEREANTLGYYLLRQAKTEEAIQLFVLNTELFPDSPNVFDSLGEAYTVAGKTQQAIDSYQRVLVLDPVNQHAKEMILQLTTAKKTHRR